MILHKEKLRNVLTEFNIIVTNELLESILELNQPTLSSNVEKDLKTLEDWLYRKKSLYVPDGIAIVNKLRKALSDKNKRISELNDVLEITVISEMLDLIKNGEPIPLTRKELQGRLNAIGEVLIKEYKEEGYFSEYTNEINEIIGETK